MRFSSRKSVQAITPPQETKGLLQLLSKFFCQFGGGVPLPPYVHPIRPKVTQCHPSRDPRHAAIFACGWKTERSGRGPQRNQSINTRFVRSPFMFTPTRHFFHPYCKYSTSSQSTLGPPLRGAWVALGPRLGHPRATQSQTQSPAESHRQRVATPKCENPASSRVKSLMWHSRPRL